MHYKKIAGYWLLTTVHVMTFNSERQGNEIISKQRLFIEISDHEQHASDVDQEDEDTYKNLRLPSLKNNSTDYLHTNPLTQDQNEQVNLAITAPEKSSTPTTTSPSQSEKLSTQYEIDKSKSILFEDRAPTPPLLVQGFKEEINAAIIINSKTQSLASSLPTTSTINEKTALSEAIPGKKPALKKSASMLKKLADFCMCCSSSSKSGKPIDKKKR